MRSGGLLLEGVTKFFYDAVYNLIAILVIISKHITAGAKLCQHSMAQMSENIVFYKAISYMQTKIDAIPVAIPSFIEFFFINEYLQTEQVRGALRRASFR